MVFIYTSNECPKCHALVNWFKEKNIRYDEINPVGATEITEFRLNGIFSLELPIMRVGGALWYVPNDLFHEDGSLDGDRLCKIFQI